MALDAAVAYRDVHADLRSELLQGLLQPPRSINPKFFYDERGSELFRLICNVEEYYPTRTEIGILQRYSREIAQAVGDHCQLLEPGAGACEKVRHLLGDLRLDAYLPLDISGDFLLSASDALRAEYPDLVVHPLVADFNDSFDLPPLGETAHRVVFYPGSTIGNFTPAGARSFLARAAALVGAGGGLLIGVDLHKSSDILNAAYNDAQGYTAAFNLNVLSHANVLLQADFDVSAFAHVAFYNESEHRIEMHLESLRDQRVRCPEVELAFRAGERIHTEYSHKYTLEGFCTLAKDAGFASRNCWTDPEGLFSVQYLEVEGAAAS
ncbi:MAG: L-histidine N(alpha)-methyltransferase [Pseudomonadota bacterium]